MGCSRQASMFGGNWGGGEVVAGREGGGSVRCTVNRWVVNEGGMDEERGVGEYGMMRGGLRSLRGRAESTDNGMRDDQGFFVELKVPIPWVRRSLIDCIGVALCLIRHLDHVA